MNTQAHLARNSLWMLVSRAGSQLLAVLFTVLLARQLGSRGFGEYAFMVSVLTIGNALTTFGTDMLLIREIAGNGQLSGLGEALLIQLALSAAFIAAVIAGAPYFPNQSPEAVLGLRITSLGLIPLAFFSVFTAALRGRQRMGAYMVLNLALAAMQAGAAALVMGLGGNVVTAAALLTAVQAAAALLAGVLCRAHVPGFGQALQFSLQKAVRLGRACIPIALLALAGMLYQKLSVAMLSAIGGAVVTGWFAAALRTVEASKTVHLAVFTALYPAMAQEKPEQAALGSRAPWDGTFGRSWWLLLGGAGAAALALNLLAGPLAQVLYGPAFAPAVPAIRILAWTLVPFTVNNFLSLARLAAHQESAILRVLLVGVASQVVLNAWWIPQSGLAGACLAALLAESVMAAAYLIPGMISMSSIRRPV